MRHSGELEDYAAIVRELVGLPPLLLEVKRDFEATAAMIAADIKDIPYHIIVGSGSVWPQAFYYGMCILEEMQWIERGRSMRRTSSTARWNSSKRT